MVEPLLLNITQRYNYVTEMPAEPGFLTKSFPRLMLARLGPGHKQSAHVDLGSSSIVPHKIHIVLSDAAGKAVFAQRPPSGRGQGGKGGKGQGSRQEETSVGQGARQEETFVESVLQAGYAYEVNNLLSHYAINRGTTPRTHLLVEYLPRDVGSEWIDNRSGPMTQTELQNKLARDRAAMTPAELEEYTREKQLQRERRHQQLRERVDLGNQGSRPADEQKGAHMRVMDAQRDSGERYMHDQGRGAPDDRRQDDDRDLRRSDRRYEGQTSGAARDRGGSDMHDRHAGRGGKGGKGQHMYEL